MPRAKAETVCPDRSQFQRLVSAQLSEPEKEAVLRHLEGCDSCANTLSSLPEQDTLAELIRQAYRLGDESSGKDVARLVQRLSQLRPSRALAPAEPGALLSFACPVCGKGLKVAAAFAGKTGRCTRCKSALRVPADAQGRAQLADPSVAEPSVSVNPQSQATVPPSLEGKSVGARPRGKVKEPTYDFLGPPQAPDEMGRLGPYRVLQVLGAGGMGVVFRAEDPHLKRLVALKAMLPMLADSDRARQRFLREARAAAAVSHDHIITVYQVGEDRGVPFLAMPFLEGEPLDRRLQREGILPTTEQMRIGREIALGLAAAHGQGLIHRDIKPANIWLEARSREPGASASGGRVKILDFGLARPISEEGCLTQMGVIVGTPAYMAPEQGQGKSVDARCDLFSLGCVLYRMATGKNAFTGADMISTLMAVATADPPPPDTLNSAVPAAMSKLILDLLAKQAEARPASAQVVAEALERISREQEEQLVAGEAKAAPPPIPAGVPVPSRVVGPSPFDELVDHSTPTLGAKKAKRDRAAANFKLTKQWPIAAGVAVCFVLILTAVWSAGVFKVKTKEGTIVLENIPADAVVLVDGETVSVQLAGDGKRIEVQVAPGKRALQITAPGFKMETREVTLASGERRPMGLRLEPLAVAAEPVVVPREAPPVGGTAVLDALRRDTIPPEALALAGNGDPKRAPASLVAVLGEAQPNHTGDVNGLAYSPDGRWLASGSGDKTIMLRDAATGRVQRILQGHTGAVTAVGFSQDGRTLVSAGHDGTLRLWSVDKDEKPAIVEANLGKPVIRVMAVSPDGRFVAAAGDSGLIKLWKWGAWEKPTELRDLSGKVSISALAFSPDGALLACAGHEGKENEKAPRARIYATADGTPRGSMPLSARGILALSFSHDGKHLAAVAHEGHGRVWEVTSAKTITELTRATFGGEWNNAYSVAWSPDDKTLAVGTQSTRIMVYDFPSGAKRTLWFPAQNQDHVRSLSFSPHGEMLAAGSQFAATPVWDTATWQLKFLERGHPRRVRSVAISPDERELLSLGDETALLRWQFARLLVPVVFHLGDFGTDIRPYLDSVSYSNDGKTYVAPCSQVIVVWNTVTQKETVNRTLPLGLRNPTVSPDGRTVAAGGGDGYIHLWDLALGRDIHRFSTKGRWCGLVFSRDGKFLASCNEETKRGTLWNVATGEEGCSWEGKSVSKASAFSPDGQIVVTGHDDGSILLRDTATGQMKRALAGHSAPICSLKFTPDGKTLVSSGGDGIIRLWNPENVRAREVIPVGPANRPLTFDLDASGKYLFAAGHCPVIFVLRLPPG